MVSKTGKGNARYPHLEVMRIAEMRLEQAFTESNEQGP